MSERFTGSFTQQDPIPEAAQAAALRILQTGRLHRYDLMPNETGEVGLFEAEFAAHMGARYCLAVASGGAAMTLALRALGVGAGDFVLCNAFTLAPVPGSIAAVGARPVLVECTEALTIDLDDLAAKIGQARVLLLSHMRGHICDMDRLMAICDGAGVSVIEDCAHTMGAKWRGVWSGRHGRIGCYSTQTYKHLNSGEGGLLISDDAGVMARATLLSGSYMLYDRHPAGPPPEAYVEILGDVPNMSCRMDHLRAAILRPQLAVLDERCAGWTARYRVLELGLAGTPGLTLITRPVKEAFVGSSFQFLLQDWPKACVADVVAACQARGVSLKWFGATQPAGYTSRYDHWSFAAPEPLPRTDRVLAGLLDMRVPLTFTLDDCEQIARIVRQEIGQCHVVWSLQRGATRTLQKEISK